MSDILQMRNITKEFPGVKALQDVSITVSRGEVHAICGENGAGKSTLMKVLSGIYPVGSYGGEIYFEDELAQFHGIKDSEAAGIVIIHQELALVPTLSIAENLFLGNEKARGGFIDWDQTYVDSRQLLARVGLHDNPETLVGQIGVGKQQLVEIAKALSKRVKLLILDEPTAALNDEDSAHLLDLIRHLRGQGITCIIISHKLNEIEAISDKVTVIRDGKTVETLDFATDHVTEDRIIKDMVGRQLDARFPDRDVELGPVTFQVKNWNVFHPTDPTRAVIRGANLEVRAGEVVGIAGLMGAGRTELAMSVFGRSYGTRISGEVFVNGNLVDTHTVPAAIHAGIAYATEDRKRYGLNLIDDIKRNISAANLGRLARMGWVDGDQEAIIADGYRDSMRIKAPSVSAIVGQLSGGNQQKVVLSKWLFTEPEVLILDEPTRGIDVGAKYEIYLLINRLAASGKAVLVISSELPELLGICDRIYALSEGVITGQQSVSEATPESLMQLMTKEKEPDHVSG